MFSSLSLFVIIILQYLTILLGCTVRVGTKPCDGLLRLSLGFRQNPPATLAGVSSESLTTLARVSSARSRSPCTHGDCSLLLPERLTRTLTPPVSSRSRPHAQPPHSFADGSSLPRSFASCTASAPPRRRLLAAQQLRMGRGARWPPRRKKGDGGGSQKTQRLLEQSVAQRQAFSAESSRSWPKALSWVSSVPRVLER